MIKGTIKDEKGRRDLFAVLIYTYGILMTNDICIAQVTDGVQMMKRTPYYRHSLKRYLNAAEKEIRRYERTLLEVMGETSWEFADMNDRFDEEVNAAVETLYWQFKQTLDSHGMAYSGEIARFELARTLTEYACRYLDERRRTREMSAGIPGHRLKVDYLRLTELSRLMNRAFDCLYVDKAVDMNTDKCRMAFDVLNRRLGDAEIIAKAAMLEPQDGKD